MQQHFGVMIVCAVTLVGGQQASAIGPTAEEICIAREWMAGVLGRPSDVDGASKDRAQEAGTFFSFLYDNQNSADLLKQWGCRHSTRQIADHRIEHTLVYAERRTGLQVRCVVVEYTDFPAVEWTLYLKNAGTQDTPVLENICGLDVFFRRDNSEEFLLHGIKGDSCVAESYQPYRLTLGPHGAKKFGPPDYSGKSSDGPDGWPYFNLQKPRGGVIIAVGWPGQWACSFFRDASNGLRITAGQERMHLRLKPGEEIRTPLIALLFWQGQDVVRSQNLWRRWYVAHVLPRVDGKPQSSLTQIQTAATESSVANVKQFWEAGIRPDICWRDAAWYPCEKGPYRNDMYWLNTGTWTPNPVQFPRGFRPFSDWAHANGMKFLLWFEPERVGDPDSWLAKNHPEWLLPGGSHGGILDEGNPVARQWLIEHIDGMIKSEGIDWYREDMNGGGPLPAWRRHDSDPDRQGVTENFYVQGHLAFWDELKRRNPKLRIDSCASGGRRNDLETMRRAVPLLRSDFQFPRMNGVVEGNQGHTYGLSFWLPFQGTGCYLYDLYSARSFYLPSFGMGELTPQNAAIQRKAYEECRRMAPVMLFGDYYPLTPYSLELDRWIAWQFHWEERGEGVVQAFRRKAAKDASIQVKLQGLDPDGKYILQNFDVAETIEKTGRELGANGVAITVGTAPGAAIISYKKSR